MSFILLEELTSSPRIIEPGLYGLGHCFPSKILDGNPMISEGDVRQVLTGSAVTCVGLCMLGNNISLILRNNTSCNV